MATQALTAGVQNRWLLVRKLMVLAALACVVAHGMDRIVLVHGDSVPYAVFWRDSHRMAVRGTYVMFEMSHPVIGIAPRMLTKQLVCDAGDVLHFRDGTFSCNGVHLGAFLHRTWDGKPLTPFDFNGRVPTGKVFVMGTHSRSFDSRYFGFVERDSVTALRPIL